MKRLAFLLFISALPLLGSGSSEFTTPQNVKLGGELAQRVQLTEKRLAGHPFDLDLIVQDVARRPELTRRFEEYQGDVSGRTLGAMSYLALLTGQRSARLDSIFERILPHQKPEGFFGVDQAPMHWDEMGRQVFGHGRLLGGLVLYYQLTGDPRALEAAAKLGDYFIATIPTWTTLHAGNPWSDHDPLIDWKDNASNRRHFVKTHMTSILESLMMLHQVAPKPELLAAAKEMVALLPDFGQYHSHSYLNTMVGMAMLYEKTRDHAVLSRLYNLYWQDVQRHAVPHDGGICEFFPEDLRTEGCSLTDWIRLNLYLWKITQDGVYLDEAENAWYNALNFHQTGNGAFGHAVRTPTGYAAEYSEAWWCCTMHGLWAYCDILQFMAVARENDVWLNFYAASEFNLDVNGSPARFVVDTAYPQEGVVTVRFDGKPTDFNLHLRIPRWARNYSVEINGKTADGVKKRGELIIERTWKKGDTLTLRLPLSVRLMDADGNNLLESRAVSRELQQIHLFYGPLLLTVDAKHNTHFPEAILFDAGKNYRVKGNDKPFALSAHFMIPAVINGFESTVLLTPLSEQTGHDQWSNEWRRFQRNGEEPIKRSPVMTTLPVRIR